jgi:hypothetical protein
MAFTDLLSTSFLFSVAIIIILIGGIFAYVSYRMSEQDHKIASMLGLIATMAEEIQFFRSKLSQVQRHEHNPNHGEEENQNDYIQMIPVLDPNNLITGVTEKSKLISVSDDELSEDLEEDLESDSDLESELDEEDSEDESDEDVDLEDDDISVENEDYIKSDLEEIVNLEQSDLNLEDNKNSMEDNNNIKSIHLEEPINLIFANQEIEIDHSDEILSSDLKSISITDLEESNKKPDYKKMSITKLREVVVEKGIIADASKLKKNDLLKLLGDE